MSSARARRGTQRRRRTLWKLAGVAIACAALAGFSFAAQAFARDPRFALAGVGVSGNVRTPGALIVGAAGLPAGANVWLLHARAAAARVERLPWIDSATVRRTWPNVVTVEVTERVAAARLRQAGPGGAPHYALIDRTLRVLTVDELRADDAALVTLSISPAPAAPWQPGETVEQPDVAVALDAYDRLRLLGVRPMEVDVAPSTGVSAVTDTEFRVLFGKPDQLDRKVALFEAIAARLNRPKDVAYIDVRTIRAPTVQYR